MKTRIISGAVLIAVVAAVAFAHIIWGLNFITVAFFCILAALGIYEMLYNTGVAKNRITVFLAAVYGAVMQVVLVYFPEFSVMITAIYAVSLAGLTLKFHAELSHSAVLSLLGLPIALSYAFYSVYALFDKSVLFLLLLLNFSAVCDTGAYFTGVCFGRHKLCPEISPKKTVEGAIGGIVFSLIVSVILVFSFDIQSKWLIILITPVMNVIGMMGDLFTSVIKRSANIKDYGWLIPGHGGIMDRFDSILLIAPVFYALLPVVNFGV